MTVAALGRRRLLVAAAMALLVAACGPGDRPTIEGTHWRAIFVGGRPPVPGQEPTLTLGPTRLSGSAGCNGYGSQRLAIGPGSLTTGVAIDIGEVSGNAAICDDPAVMEVETAFIEILRDVEQLRLDSGNLVLEGPHGRLRFQQVDSVE